MASLSSQNEPQLQMLFTHRCQYWAAALPYPRDTSHPNRSPGGWHWPDLLCLKQEAGDKHKQLPNLWAPSKPRLSPGGAVPAESRAEVPGYIHLQRQIMYWSFWPKPGPGRCREGMNPPQHPASSRRCWEQQGRPCHVANPLCNSRFVGSCGFGCRQSGQQLPAAGPQQGCGSVCRNCGCNRRQIGT